MSTTTEVLIEELGSAPESIPREVLDFLAFLKARRVAQEARSDNLLPPAQTAWDSDWARPEEENAWRDS